MDMDRSDLVLGAGASAVLALAVTLPIVARGLEGLWWSAAIAAASVVVLEALFRLLYRRRTGKPYQLIPKVPFDRIYFEPHPYLPYVYKRAFVTQPEVAGRHALNRDKRLRAPQLRTNSRGWLDGPGGDREVAVPKPPGLTRVCCLGASTTMSYLKDESGVWSYPLALERCLADRLPGRTIEVNNCGVGGYTSADLLIKFLLDVVDAQPDVVVIYHAYNDLGPSLTPGFRADYAHARGNLGETYWRYRLASWVPYVPLAWYNHAVNLVLPQNVRHALLRTVTRRRPDPHGPFGGLATYRRNLEHILQVCRARDIGVVLSTFCHYLYPAVQDRPLYLKYGEGLEGENGVIRALAAEYGCPLVDAAADLPHREEYFVDSVHFTPEGMRELARRIAGGVEAALAKR
jgi:lysophospholipase L1-like esterase